MWACVGVGICLNTIRLYHELIRFFFFALLCAACLSLDSCDAMMFSVSILFGRIADRSLLILFFLFLFLFLHSSCSLYLSCTCFILVFTLNIPLNKFKQNACSHMKPQLITYDTKFMLIIKIKKWNCKLLRGNFPSACSQYSCLWCNCLSVRPRITTNQILQRSVNWEKVNKHNVPYRNEKKEINKQTI